MLEFFGSGYDRVFLERIVSLEELGYYSVGVSIAGYLSVFSMAINSTFSPDLYAAIAIRDLKKCSKIIFLQLLFISVITIFFIICAPFLVELLTAGRYTNSIIYVQIIALTAITSCLCYSLDQITIGLEYPKIALVTKILGSILCVVLFSTLIQYRSEERRVGKEC